MKKKIIYIKDLLNKDVKSFLVTEETFLDHDEKSPCDYCKIKDYCENNERYAIYSLEESVEKYPRFMDRDSDFCYSHPCEYFFNNYDSYVGELTEYNKTNNGILLKKNSEQVYGDELTDMQEHLDLKYLLLPDQIINDFCKKTCPHWNGKDFHCMKQLYCPFYEFLNNCYDLL